MIKTSIYSFVFITFSFSLIAMEGKPKIDFSNVSAQALEEFAVVYRLPYYMQLTPRTRDSLATRMQQLNISPEGNTFIALINKMIQGKKISKQQENTLILLKIARLQKGHNEVMLTTRANIDGPIVGTVVLTKK